MLVLTLKPISEKDEMVYIDVRGEIIGIAIVKISGKQARLGFRCDRDFNIYRGRLDGTPTTTTDENGNIINNGDDNE